jgi:hypothetical protein
MPCAFSLEPFPCGQFKARSSGPGFFTSYDCKCKVKKGGKKGMEFGREMGKGLAIIG